MKNHLKIVLVVIFGSLYLLLSNGPIIKYDKNVLDSEQVAKFTSSERTTEQNNENKHLANKENVFKYEVSSVLHLKMIKKFHIRKKKVECLCLTVENTDNITLQKAVMKMVVDLKHNLAWCPVYKAASTMLMKKFAVLSGISEFQSIDSTSINYNFIIKQKFRPNKSLSQTLKQISRSKKLMVVRHPFERLLSAYRDKLENMQGREYYYKHYGHYITHRYRAKQSNLTSLEPSFNEFLQFVAKEKIYDEHWVPFFDSCQPCSINYDYIIQFESLSNEYNFFIKENNLENYLNYLGGRSESIDSKNVTDDSIAEEYFKYIPKSLLEKIFNIYRLDFFLFSYSPAKYYFMTSDANKDLYNFMMPN